MRLTSLLRTGVSRVVVAPRAALQIKAPWTFTTSVASSRVAPQQRRYATSWCRCYHHRDWGEEQQQQRNHDQPPWWRHVLAVGIGATVGLAALAASAELAPVAPDTATAKTAVANSGNVEHFHVGNNINNNNNGIGHHQAKQKGKAGKTEEKESQAHLHDTPVAAEHQGRDAAAAGQSDDILEDRERHYLAPETGRPRSRPRFEHPNHKGLTVLVADAVDEVILRNTEQDVFLDVYAHACEACKVLHPVMLQIAYALEPFPSVTVASMEGTSNFKEGFLSKNELAAFPVLKMFPAVASPPRTEESNLSGEYAKVMAARRQDAAMEYNNRPSAETIIRFIHQHARTKFDLNIALDRSAEKDAETRKAVKERIRERISHDEIYPVFRAAPCGVEQDNLFLHHMLHSYFPCSQDLDRYQKEYLQCAKRCHKRNLRYWREVRSAAESQVEMLEAEDKKDDKQKTNAK